MMSMTEPTEFTYYVEPFLIRTLYLEIAFRNMMPMTEPTKLNNMSSLF